MNHVEKITLLLLYLTSWDEKVLSKTIKRSWKGYPFESLDELERLGLLSQTKRAKSVYLTDRGIRLAKELASTFNIGDESGQNKAHQHNLGTHAIFQFKIELRQVKPKVWRRIQVPGAYSFWDLHVAIQDAMGWLDYHLHEFECIDSKGNKKCIGLPDGEHDKKTLLGKDENIAEWFSLENNKAVYSYDFGDGWEHDITLESILDPKENQEYPVCIEGKEACPPEDCGGPYGYEDLLKIVADKKHPEYKTRKRWLGKFDIGFFDPKKVRFDNPTERWELAQSPVWDPEEEGK